MTQAFSERDVNSSFCSSLVFAHERFNVLIFFKIFININFYIKELVDVKFCKNQHFFLIYLVIIIKMELKILKNCKKIFFVTNLKKFTLIHRNNFKKLKVV